MYQVTQDFIDNAKKHGRLLDIRLSFDGNVLNGEDVNSVEKEFEVVMLGTSSQKLTGEIVGRYDLTDSVIKVEIGIAYNESPFSYVDYGFFIVKEHDRIVGAKGSQDKTTFVAYDIMLNAHELYDVDKLGVTYPISVFNLYQAIATYIGTEVSETSVVNGNMMIEEDKYTNIENVTYRNVLDDLSATMGASIIVSKNKLLAKYANTGVNLIKNDFSDFTGSATVKKTFPIHIFKGGRNLLLDSKGTIDLTTSTWEPFEYNTWEEIGV